MYDGPGAEHVLDHARLLAASASQPLTVLVTGRVLGGAEPALVEVDGTALLRTAHLGDAGAATFIRQPLGTATLSWAHAHMHRQPHGMLLVADRRPSLPRGLGWLHHVCGDLSSQLAHTSDRCDCGWEVRAVPRLRQGR
ncbi:hypothetical protein ASG73_00880 [Janibacter sp. Soil728]|uniref:hypothetical protein n=1 Tax=Janibacter sp. Soil728 TaxID=1736393 RepID=UPI0006FC1E1E|nr:hypothetical protein [Janibacter sp. Soil728]KRE38954.1 hypothetical protein ASG73_00880 [Janibacter sp. Soil728]